MYAFMKNYSQICAFISCYKPKPSTVKGPSTETLICFWFRPFFARIVWHGWRHFVELPMRTNWFTTRLASDSWAPVSGSVNCKCWCKIIEQRQWLLRSQRACQRWTDNDQNIRITGEIVEKVGKKLFVFSNYAKTYAYTIYQVPVVRKMDNAIQWINVNTGWFSI